MVDRVANTIDNVASKWWLLLLRGLAAIAVGIVAFVHPGDTLVAMVIVLGAYACFAGILAIVAAISGFGGDHWWALLLEGIIAIVAAGIIWSWPVSSTLAFVYFVAAWLIVSGILQVAGGVRLHDVINNEWIYVLTGVISIAFGVWIFRNGAEGVVVTAFLLGWYFLLYGIAEVVVAFRLRSLHGTVATPTVKHA